MVHLKIGSIERSIIAIHVRRSGVCVPVFILARVCVFFLSNTDEHDTSANKVVTKTVSFEQASDQQKGSKINPFYTALWSDTQVNVFLSTHWTNDRGRFEWIE